MIKEFGGDYIQWLRGFYQVAQSGSVSAAARVLNLRQPTVSHQIKCLEEHYGVTLFDRSKGGMVLTPEGREMLGHAISIFESVEEILERLNPRKTDFSGTISIASTHALIVYFLAPYVTRFSKQYPAVNFELIGGMLDLIEKGVDTGTADFGVVYLDPAGLRYAENFLFNTSLSLIASHKNQFGIKEGISLADISSLPFLGYPPNSTIKDLVYRRFKQEGCSINSLLILNHFEAIKTFVKLDMGVSIIFDYALTEYDKSQMQIISLYEYFGDIPIGTITRKRKYLAPASKAFLAELTQSTA